MNDQLRDQLTNQFSNFVSEHKKSLIEEVLSMRTRHITVVLEDIFQSQNASAAVRTCDCFGIQDLHVIEEKNKYEVNPRVVHGSSKWVDIHHYGDEEGVESFNSCVNELKIQGYKLVGTTPKKNCTSIYDLSVNEKTALMFGTELTGLSENALDVCDELVHVPMVGFTESFNISVSVALCLGYLTHRLYDSDINWRLSEDEKANIRLAWYRKVVPNAEIMEKEFLKKI